MAVTKPKQPTPKYLCGKCGAEFYSWAGRNVHAFRCKGETRMRSRIIGAILTSSVFVATMMVPACTAQCITPAAYTKSTPDTTPSDCEASGTQWKYRVQAAWIGYHNNRASVAALIAEHYVMGSSRGGASAYGGRMDKSFKKAPHLGVYFHVEPHDADKALDTAQATCKITIYNEKGVIVKTYSTAHPVTVVCLIVKS